MSCIICSVVTILNKKNIDLYLKIDVQTSMISYLSELMGINDKYVQSLLKWTK
jgi:hypothetical protein